MSSLGPDERQRTGRVLPPLARGRVFLDPDVRVREAALGEARANMIKRGVEAGVAGQTPGRADDPDMLGRGRFVERRALRSRPRACGTERVKSPAQIGRCGAERSQR